MSRFSNARSKLAALPQARGALTPVRANASDAAADERSAEIAAEVAGSASEGWRTAFDDLAQVLGKQGVAALYKRCLFLSRHEHSALAALYERGAWTCEDLPNLRQQLAQLSPAEVVAAQALLVRRFNAVLGQLIGPTLSAQLLRPVLDHSSSGNAAEDPKP